MRERPLRLGKPCHRRLLWLLSAAAAIAVLAPVLAHARIFLRYGAGSSIAASGRWGKAVYEANFQINNGRASIAVLDSGAIVDVLVRRGGAEEDPIIRWLPGGREVRIGLARWRDRTARLVAVAAGDGGKCMVFSIEQSLLEARASAPRGIRDLLPGLASIGATPTFYVRNEETRTALETARLPGEPAEALAAVAGGLRREGWQPALEGGAAAAAGTLLYVRGHDVCCATARPGGTGGGSLVTVLHKQGGVD